MCSPRAADHVGEAGSHDRWIASVGGLAQRDRTVAERLPGGDGSTGDEVGARRQRGEVELELVKSGVMVSSLRERLTVVVNPRAAASAGNGWRELQRFT